VILSAVIIIPCYNEAERLPVHTFQAFTCERHAPRFLFVNDGSLMTPGGCWKPSIDLIHNGT
jgi:hypothetical protein